MRKVCVSLAVLWKNGARQTKHGYTIRRTEEGENEYFDLVKGDDPLMLCCDGEECTIMEENDHSVILYNEDSERPFILSREEFGLSTFTG